MTTPHSVSTPASSMTSRDQHALFLRACRGEDTPRPPLWIMRQAGRYLSGYRQVRAKHDFLTVCRTPELACEVTLQPILRFALDAAIVFSDIMMPLESMGVDLTFAPGPIIGKPIDSRAAVDALVVPQQDAIAPYVGESIKLLRRELPVPLIGFAGAPWTLAAYLIEGKGSKDFARARGMAHAAPEVLTALLNKLAHMTLAYLKMQIASGAQAVQLFDSWAGLLDRTMYERFALPAVRTILDGLLDAGVPRIYFANDAAHLLPVVRHLSAEVLAVDWRMPLSEVRRQVGPQWVLQGNLDPTVLLGQPDYVAAEAARVLKEGAGTRHIFNLGHGILPATPEASVDALVAAIRGQSQP